MTDIPNIPNIHRDLLLVGTFFELPSPQTTNNGFFGCHLWWGSISLQPCPPSPSLKSSSKPSIRHPQRSCWTSKASSTPQSICSCGVGPAQGLEMKRFWKMVVFWSLPGWWKTSAWLRFSWKNLTTLAGTQFFSLASAAMFPGRSSLIKKIVSTTLQVTSGISRSNKMHQTVKSKKLCWTFKKPCLFYLSLSSF